MSITFREGEWHPVNSGADEWTGSTPRRALPLGHCSTWGTDGTNMFFGVTGAGDPEWMRHVVETLATLGVAFMAGIYRCADRCNPEGPKVLQFCVAMAREDADEFMPRISQAYDIAEAVTGGVA